MPSVNIGSSLNFLRIGSAYTLLEIGSNDVFGLMPSLKAFTCISERIISSLVVPSSLRLLIYWLHRQDKNTLTMHQKGYNKNG